MSPKSLHNPYLFSFFDISLPIRERFLDREKTARFISDFAKKDIPFVLEFAVPHFGASLKTSVGIPHMFKDSARASIEREWANATLTESPGTSIGWTGASLDGAHLKLSAKASKESDSFLKTLNALAKTGLAGEGIIFQVAGLPGSERKNFSVNFRIASSAPSPMRAKALLDDVLSASTFRSIGAKGEKFLNSFLKTEFSTAHAFAFTPEELSKKIYI